MFSVKSISGHYGFSISLTKYLFTYDNLLKNLGLGNANYSDLMGKLAILSGIYLLMSWLGLSYFGPSFIDTEDVW